MTGKQFDSRIARVEVLVEDLISRFDGLVEIVKAMHQNMVTKAELTEVKEDIKIIKAAVTDTSAQVHDHERRITHLESSAT